MTNSSVPPESRAVITGLRARNAFERRQPVVLVERRVDEAECVRVERDELGRR